MIQKSKSYALLAGALLGAASLMTAQANTFVKFSVDMSTNILLGTFTQGTDTVYARGTFSSPTFNLSLPLVLDGTTASVYTNTVNDTADANGGRLEYKFYNNNGAGVWESTATGNNRAALLPSTSGASLVLPTAFFGDAGGAVNQSVKFQVDMAQQVALGAFNPSSDAVVVRGNLLGWGGNPGGLANKLEWDPSQIRTNQYLLTSTNVYTNTFVLSSSPAAAVGYKFVIPNGVNDNWEAPLPVNLDNGGNGNRYFANSANQTLPIVFFSDNPYAPIVSNITFSVDMSVVVITDTNFNPATVTVNGDLMGWGGVSMTNNPNAANTNIYTVQYPNVGAYAAGVGSGVNYQYRYTLLSSPGSTVYDHYNGANGGNNNRFYQVANVPSTNLLSVFNDASLSDYLTQPTPVFFSVNMTGAIGTDTHVFNPASDNVYINGQFANWYAWSGGINPASAPPGFQMIESNAPSGIYTNTIVIPAGIPVAFNYKYGMDINAALGGPLDNEAGFGQNHYRVVRATKLNPYVMAQDTFGTMYGEPFFNSGNTAAGQLNVGAPVAGKVPVTWLGRPGARLQVKDSLSSGAWLTLPETDGTNWTAGSSSTNGFVSKTNWPATSIKFFRLVKP